jgi:hypothetical protein
MGIPVMILGESASGKSSSLRNFTADEVGVFNIAGKRLPFKSALPVANNPSYAVITATLEKASKKAYVIDDSQYLLCFEMFERAKEVGYQKFTDMAQHFYQLIQTILRKTPDDVIVYFLHHTELTADGKRKAKTIGKMLDEKLTVEGLFTIVLLCETDGERHWFTTQSDGTSTAKSPIGMFAEREIDNDLKAVDTAIREYYEIGGNTNEEV